MWGHVEARWVQDNIQFHARTCSSILSSVLNLSAMRSVNLSITASGRTPLLLLPHIGGGGIMPPPPPRDGPKGGPGPNEAPDGPEEEEEAV